MSKFVSHGSITALRTAHVTSRRLTQTPYKCESKVRCRGTQRPAPKTGALPRIRVIPNGITQYRRPNVGGLETTAPCSPLAISRFVINSSFDIRISPFDSSASFQEEIHAIEIDYGIRDVQRVHPQNATDSGAALPQGETR